MNAVPVLTYHAIARARTPIAVSPGRFSDTMRAMKRAGWRTLGLDDLLTGLADGRWPDRTFALHFDDGFASVLEHGCPGTGRVRVHRHRVCGRLMGRPQE